MPLSHCQGDYSFTSYELLWHKVFVLGVIVAYLLDRGLRQGFTCNK